MPVIRDIPKWHPRKWEVHLLKIQDEYLEGRVDPARLDEAIIILLEGLKLAMGNSEMSPLALFEEVYQERTGVWEPLIARFQDSKALVERFRGSDEEERRRIRPQLVSRGLV